MSHSKALKWQNDMIVHLTTVSKAVVKQAVVAGICLRAMKFSPVALFM